MAVNKEVYALNYRQLKSKVLEILGLENFQENVISLIETYTSKMIVPLFSASYNPSKDIRWHAVSSFGYLARHLAPHNLSKTHDMVRRCIWMLTEESGGIPWNAPAIMGEIMANNRDIAGGYSSILFSYVDEPDMGPENFLDTLQLRVSAYWGIFRLSQTFPEFVRNNEKIILQRLERENDPDSLTLLCLTAANAGLNTAFANSEKISSDTKQVELYINEKFSVMTPREAFGQWNDTDIAP